MLVSISHARIAAAISVLLAAAAFCATADARTYGSRPLNISVAPGPAAANGSSGHPDVSGDDRHARYVAFDSLASNLVKGDNNQVSDVFVWRRPGGVPKRLRSGKLRRVSTGRYGEANGPSTHPSIDGSLYGTPHCVAFQSTATNLSPSDALPDSDIYVRDLRRGRTYLVSRGVAGDATNPSISGNCRKVAFEAEGKVMYARPTGGKVHSLAAGSSPDYSRDSKSITYVGADGKVVFRHGGYKATLSNGSNPMVSDRSPVGGWAVVYNAGPNVKLAKIKSGHKSRRIAVRNATAGGVSSQAANRGIVVWARGGALNYLNLHSGNSDDLAYAHEPITQIAISARVNLVAYAGEGAIGAKNPRGVSGRNIYVKWLSK